MKFCPRCGKPLGTREDGGRPRAACLEPGCGFVHYDNPVPVVAAIVEHEGSVLLVRSVGWPEKMYGLVTGFLEKSESPEAGVLRELQEELGLQGEIVRLVGVYPFEPMNQVIVAYHLRASGEVKLGSELAGYKRIDPQKLRPWDFGTGAAVRDWLASNRPEHEG